MKSLKLKNRHLSLAIMCLALLVSILDANSQTRRYSHGNTRSKSANSNIKNTSPADGQIHVNIGESSIGRGYTTLPYEATFRETKKTSRGPITVEYTCHIEWPDYFDPVYQDQLPKIKEAITQRVIKLGETELAEVVAGVDMTSNLISWIETRVSALRYKSDTNGLYNGPRRDNLRISFIIDNGNVEIVTEDIVTDLNNKTIKYETKDIVQ